MPCRTCIKGHIDTYSVQENVPISMVGDDLTGLHILTIEGVPTEAKIPEEALPDCEACAKPELGPLNQQAVWLYSKISSQQMIGDMSGNLYGLRFEALVAAIKWYTGSGEITDPDEVMERVQLIDEIAIGARNDRAAAKRESEKASK